MSKLKKTIFYLFLTVLLTGLSGCEREGPMERAGKKIDKAVKKPEKQSKKPVRKRMKKKNSPTNLIKHQHPAFLKVRRLNDMSNFRLP